MRKWRWAPSGTGGREREKQQDQEKTEMVGATVRVQERLRERVSPWQAPNGMWRRALGPELVSASCWTPPPPPALPSFPPRTQVSYFLNHQATSTVEIIFQYGLHVER